MLSESEQLKTKIFGTRIYEICPHTLLRIIDYDSAVYDFESDQMFVSQTARNQYYAELKFRNKTSEKSFYIKKKVA